MTASCSRYNNISNCLINSPNIIKTNFLILGWNTSPTDSFGDWLVNVPKTITNNLLYFAINHSGDFIFTGNTQSITLPVGTYKLELWGAQGGGITGGLGGYSTGALILLTPTTLNIYVGGQGGIGNGTIPAPGGWNGGGLGAITASSGGGGGASDIRLNGTFLQDRIIIAGAGGGTGSDGNFAKTGGKGGAGGGENALSGESGTGSSASERGKGGEGGSTVGGLAGARCSGCHAHSLAFDGTSAFGGDGGNVLNNSGGGGGGAGYYGGGGGGRGGTTTMGPAGGGGGGSGYIGGVITFNDITKQTITGESLMPNPLGGNMIGNTGDGYARITKIG